MMASFMCIINAFLASIYLIADFPGLMSILWFSDNIGFLSLIRMCYEIFFDICLCVTTWSICFFFLLLASFCSVSLLHWLAVLKKLNTWNHNVDLHYSIGIKESDAGLAAPSQWDLVSDKKMMQGEHPLEVCILLIKVLFGNKF